MMALAWIMGSLRREAAAEVHRHMASNSTFRRNQYPARLRLMRAILSRTSFVLSLGTYVVAAATVMLADRLNAIYCRTAVCPVTLPAGFWEGAGRADMLRTLASILITAQTGLIAVLSIAVALVTLIGQRQNAGPDVRVYYHESFAIPLATSSLALLAVLCLQLFWPMHAISEAIGWGAPGPAVATTLTALHILWLVANISVYTHFILISLSFGRDEPRRRYRDLYTVNVVIPMDILTTVLTTRYARCSARLWTPKDATVEVATQVYFRTPPVEGVPIRLSRPSTLHDVWLHPLSIAVWFWARRVGREGGTAPELTFLSNFDRPRDGTRRLCATSAGAEPTFLERQLIRLAFRFRRSA